MDSKKTVGLALGLDTSTQSLTAVVIDIDSRQIVYQKSLDYKNEPMLNKFGINGQYILPPKEPGEANQPVAMYFASLDAMFSDMAKELPDYGLGINEIVVINTSGQQHGHVLLNHNSQKSFGRLKKTEYTSDINIVNMLEDSLSLNFARIWRTSCTVEQADYVRDRIGGKERIIELTGSDAPLRFSAFGIMKTGMCFPRRYKETYIIHQISSLIPAVLTGEVNIPLDFGNACGTSLMDYKHKRWSEELINIVSENLGDGGSGLTKKLPKLDSGTIIVGSIANYFVVKYGISQNCAIGIGSGDNPQTKVLVSGSLLSLGSSFVNMVETDGRSFDMEGSANAMYDAFDRPFMFACRTNGALIWDDIRADYGISKDDYEPGENALSDTPVGNNGRMFFWQAETESFPVSAKFPPTRMGYDTEDFAADYAGIIESSLASVYTHSKGFMKPGNSLYVTGGATSSPEIMRRVAAIWNREVICIEGGGAALGAAVSGAYAFLLDQGEELEAGEFGSSFLEKKAAIKPRQDDINAYHADKGLLSKYEAAEAELIRD